MAQPLPPIEEHPFLRGLTPEEVRSIAHHAREVSFPAGALLLREGDKADTSMPGWSASAFSGWTSTRYGNEQRRPYRPFLRHRSVAMHESSLARQVLDTVLHRAVSDGALRVRTVRGWVAETESLSPESLSRHFAAQAQGTKAEGARLQFELIHVEARCRTCGRTYAPEHHLLLCPVCGSTDGEQLGQTGLAITSIEVE
jgi:hydrogenase nickel incorporation protein HypA/HybF